MKLYKLTQSANTGWYTYDSAIVAANSVEEARRVIPSPFYFYDKGFYYKYRNQEPAKEKFDPSWCKPSQVNVELIGDTTCKAGEVITASMRGGLDMSRAIDIAKALAVLKYDLPDAQRSKVEAALNDYVMQVADTSISFLRFHLLEANRIHDVTKVIEYERKLKDYMNEAFEDWS